MQASEFLNYKNWVVVGDVLNSTKYAYKILNALNNKNYNVAGVNPRGEGEVHKNLSEIQYNIEIIDLCINPKSGINIVKEAKSLEIDKILIQPGAESAEILDYCMKNGITAVKGCALVELANH